VDAPALLHHRIFVSSQGRSTRRISEPISLQTELFWLRPVSDRATGKEWLETVGPHWRR